MIEARVTDQTIELFDHGNRVACHVRNRSVLYQRVPRLLEALGVARGDGRYGRMLKNLARVQPLILDDWA